ncbi:hypothetical protein COV11_00170 [Candidatus Woesearchaeota archaeon CG10_big_fil_rev_8_21_14_0_10_30_7]|nr:MAG: hypothetical protein COV11_00170 [Candidatus Woesearchaeota archaeon CG10_big_fil_rev_8_21_14_0_10_30_7]
MTEYIEVLNEKKEVINKVSRKEVHEKGLFHKGICGVVLKDGKVFIQKRRENKDVFPGMYEVSYSGHVLVGESWLESAKRELKEELNIEGDFELLAEEIVVEEKVNCLFKVFLIKNITGELKLQKEEVTSGEFKTKQEIQTMLNKYKFTPITHLLFKKYSDKI